MCLELDDLIPDDNFDPFSDDDDDLFVVEEKYYTGLECTFHGLRTNNGRCPYCNGKLLEFSSYNKFISEFPKKWDLDNPIIREFFEWLSKSECHDSVSEAVKTYNNQKGKNVLYV